MENNINNINLVDENKFFNLDNLLELGSQNISKLAIFIFIIAGNYANDTFSCSLRLLIRDNMIIKHIIGLFIVLIFIGLTQEKMKIGNKILLSIFLYIWYIFMMRSPRTITLIVIGIIIVLYIIQEYMNDLKLMIDDNKDSLEEIDSKNVQLTIYNLTLLRNGLFVTSVVLSTFGFLYFYLYNKRAYKTNFKTYNFFLGMNDNECFSKFGNNKKI